MMQDLGHFLSHTLLYLGGIPPWNRDTKSRILSIVTLCGNASDLKHDSFDFWRR